MIQKLFRQPVPFLRHTMRIIKQKVTKIYLVENLGTSLSITCLQPKWKSHGGSCLRDTFVQGGGRLERVHLGDCVHWDDGVSYIYIFPNGYIICMYIILYYIILYYIILYYVYVYIYYISGNNHPLTICHMCIHIMRYSDITQPPLPGLSKSIWNPPTKR